MTHHHHTAHGLVIVHDHRGPTRSGGGVRQQEGYHNHQDEPPCPEPIDHWKSEYRVEGK